MSQVRARAEAMEGTAYLAATGVDGFCAAELDRPDEGSATAADAELVERLRRGDEQAFAWMVDRYHGSLIRLARAHVADQSVAEEVVQETWLAVLEGLDRFEGRSSVKTWMFRVLTNKAKTRGVRESRHMSVSPLPAGDEDGDEPAVDPSRFRATGHWADYWEAYPAQWDDETPEKVFLTKEGTAYLEGAIAALPPNLRQVLVLRDVEGLSSKDVCDLLAITEGNQRVLLHRARSRVRRALERYLEGGGR
ncbi:RNA polymerase sigma factor [Candidatus Nitrospira bockiana]